MSDEGMFVTSCFNFPIVLRNAFARRMKGAANGAVAAEILTADIRRTTDSDFGRDPFEAFIYRSIHQVTGFVRPTTYSKPQTVIVKDFKFEEPRYGC